MKTSTSTVIAFLCAVAALPAATEINFDSFTPGAPPPSPWNVTTANGGSVVVSSSASTSPPMSLALSLPLVTGSQARAVLPADFSASPGTQTLVSFDMNPAIILRPENNYVSGGHIDIIRSDGYRGAMVLFDVSDTNDLGGSQLPEPHELRLIFYKPDFTTEIVAYFTPGTWYHFEILFDYAAWTVTMRAETLAGGLIAERTYSNPYQVVPTQMNIYGAGGDTAYVDSIGISPPPPPPIPPAFAGLWNSLLFATPDQLRLVTEIQRFQNQDHVTLQGFEMPDAFENHHVQLTLGTDGTFSGPATGTMTLVEPGLILAQPDAGPPLSLHCNDSADVMFTVTNLPGEPFHDLELLLRAPATLSSVDLAGDWRLVVLGTPTALIAHHEERVIDGGISVPGVVSVEGADEFDVESGALAVQTDGSLTLTIDGSVFTGTATPGADGLVQVELLMPPGPPFLADFYVNAGKNTIAAVSTEGSYQQILLAVKLPPTLAPSDMQGRWRVGSLATPTVLSQPLNPIGFVTDIPEKDDFQIHREILHCGHTGAFTGPATTTVGTFSTPTPGTVVVEGSDADGEPWTSTVWINAARDLIVGIDSDSLNEIILATRSDEPAGQGLVIRKTPALSLHWSSDANVQLLQNTVPDIWTPVPGTLGATHYEPDPVAQPKALFRTAETTP